MYEYEFVTDPVELLAGTSNTISPLYTEAAKIVEGSSDKSMKYFKSLIKSIENVAARSNNEKIANSKGNIERFSGYDNIVSGLDFLSKHIPGENILKDLKNILNGLRSNRTLYVDGYDKHIRLITLEYETSVYMLVTGIVFSISSYVDFKQNNEKINIVKKSNGKDKGVIKKTINGLAKELNTTNHKNYLSELLKAKDHVVSTKVESVSYIESVVGETIDLISSITGGVFKAYKTGKNIFGTLYKTVFGIIPLIKSALYLWYKRKGDTIVALEEQIHFIQLNIEHLQNMKNMDENKKKIIIKKQEAVIEAFRKRCEKLRAELIDTEDNAAAALSEDDTKTKREVNNNDDDFILD